MKVAILNRHRGDGRGGDLVGIDNRMAALRALGVEVEYLYGDDLANRLLGKFDLAHLFHIDFDFCRPNFDAVRISRVPYVVTPIFYREFAPAGVGIAGKAVILHGAKAILPYSNREGEEIREYFGSNLRYTPIPSGTGTEFHAEPSDDRIGVCAADWGASKFSSLIAEACEVAGLPFACFRSVPHSDMPAEYRKRKVFVTVTRSDRMSLAVGEALCSGCRVLSSMENRGNEWYPGIQSIDPFATLPEIVERIRAAHEATEWDWTPNHAARALTWDRQARGYLEAYQRALNG